MVGKTPGHYPIDKTNRRKIPKALLLLAAFGLTGTLPFPIWSFIKLQKLGGYAVLKSLKEP
jgi:hypothetical protein